MAFSVTASGSIIVHSFCSKHHHFFLRRSHETEQIRSWNFTWIEWNLPIYEFFRENMRRKAALLDYKRSLIMPL